MNDNILKSARFLVFFYEESKRRMEPNLHGKYCKAIFFTSEEEKREFTKSFNEMKMNNYLHMARKYGYEG
jgi:hypothetical protein